MGHCIIKAAGGLGCPHITGFFLKRVSTVLHHPGVPIFSSIWLVLIKITTLLL